MIWVSALRPYSPGGMLNTFVRTCIILFYSINIKIKKFYFNIKKKEYL